MAAVEEPPSTSNPRPVLRMLSKASRQALEGGQGPDAAGPLSEEALRALQVANPHHSAPSPAAHLMDQNGRSSPMREAKPKESW